MVEKPTLIGREQELDELARFLDAVPAGPVGLLLEGDAGMGKTTLWLEAVSAARDRSYRVLSCRPVESEAQLAFAALGDLLEEVPESATEYLPAPQRRALDVALLRMEAEGHLRFLGRSRSASSACSVRSPRQAPSCSPSTTSSGSTDRR
jgi:hypothetical protein